VLTHVQPLDREGYEVFNLLLLGDLCVSQVEEATAARLAGLETFKLKDQNLWGLVYLELLVDVSVFLADAAVPPVITSQRLSLAVVLEAAVNVDVGLRLIVTAILLFLKRGIL